MTKNERLELNALSIKIFGRSSVWQKFMARGELTNLTRKLDDGTEESYRGYKYPTLEEIKDRLNVLLKEKEDGEKEKAEKTTKETEKIVEGTQDK